MKLMSISLAAAIIASGLLAAVHDASAQTTQTITGAFHTREGEKAPTQGTYQRTIVTDGVTTTSTTVYTRDSDQATRTAVETTTINDDGSRTVNLNQGSYGMTGSYTSQTTLTPIKHNQFVGQGTHTDAYGGQGTLTTLRTSKGGVTSVTALQTGAAASTSQSLSVENDDGSSITKEVILSQSGTPGTVITKYTVTDKHG